MSPAKGLIQALRGDKRERKSLEEVITKMESALKYVIHIEPNLFFGNPPPQYRRSIDAKIAIYGFPFDETSTFGKGADKGPYAIRKTAADLVEYYVSSLGGITNIFDKVSIFDLGDIDPKLIRRSENAESDIQKILKRGERLSKILLDMGQIPIVLGGEHTITAYTAKPCIREKPMFLHLDAHLDLKDEYKGLKTSHTTFLRRLIDFGLNPEDVIQVGIRQGDADEYSFAEKEGITVFSADDVFNNIGRVTRDIRCRTRKRKVCLSLDIDVLDSCYTPATGTPVSFGLTPRQVMTILQNIEGNPIYMDVVEVGQDANFREAEVATQFIFKMLANKF